MRGVCLADAVVALVFALSGCAALRCESATILVAETQRHERLERRLESQYTDPVSGRLQEIYRDVVVPAYWVRAKDGDWVAVDEATWRQAEKGKPLAVCR